MSIKISELPQANTVNSTDVIPIVQNGTTKQATAGMMMPAIATSITSSSTNNEVAGAKAVYDLHNGTDIIKVMLTSDDAYTPSSAWDWHTVALNAQELKYGDSFSFSASNKCITVNTNALIQIDWVVTIGLEAGISADATTARCYIRIVTDNSSTDAYIPPYANLVMVKGRANTTFGTIVANVTAGAPLYIKVQNELNEAHRLMGNRCGMTVRILQKSSGATLNSISPNTAKLMNTGELVGMGDRVELTSLASELTDNNVGEQEVKEVTPSETTEEKTEGSGDTI